MCNYNWQLYRQATTNYSAMCLAFFLQDKSLQMVCRGVGKCSELVQSYTTESLHEIRFSIHKCSVLTFDEMVVTAWE